MTYTGYSRPSPTIYIYAHIGSEAPSQLELEEISLSFHQEDDKYSCYLEEITAWSSETSYKQSRVHYSCLSFYQKNETRLGAKTEQWNHQPAR